MLQEAPGDVLAVTVACPPGLAPITEVIWTVAPCCGVAGTAGAEVAAGTFGAGAAGGNNW
jgi:hypothetical protein